MTRRRCIALAAVMAACSLAPGAARAHASSSHLEARAQAEAVRYEFFRPVVVTGVDLALAPSDAQVSTYGLDAAGSTSRARGGNADLTLFSAIPAEGPATAEQVAGPDNADPAVSTNPLGGSADAHARAFDPSAGVCPDRIVSTSGSSMVDVVADPGILEARAVSSRSTVSLEDVPGREGLAVRSTATADIAELVLADAYVVRIVGEARLSVTATGDDGGALIEYTTPVVEIADAATGEPVARLDASSPETQLDLPPNEPFPSRSFMEIRLGAPHGVIALDDGRYARASVEVLEFRWPDPAGSTEQWDLRIGALSAEAGAPLGGVRCDGTPPPAGPDVPHVLVYSGWQGFEHLAVPHGAEVIAGMANDSDVFAPTFTDNPRFLRPDVMRATDVVLWNNTTGAQPWSEEQRQLYVDHLLCGGGYVGLHSAADANYDWPEYGELVGALFEGHPHTGYWPTVGDVTVFVKDQAHPATAPWHGTDSFRIAEEVYKLSPDRDRIDVLLSLDETSTYPHVQAGVPNPAFGTGPYGDDQPLAWTKSFRGANRVFYTALGHNVFVWDRPDFRAHLLNGLLWVAGLEPDPECLATL